MKYRHPAVEKRKLKFPKGKVTEKKILDTNIHE